MIKKHGGNIYRFAKDNNIPIDSVLDFSANINPLGMPECIEEILKASEWILNYPDPNYEDLLEAIANFESVSKEHIILGNGGIECIFLIAEYMKHKKILIPAPTFVEYERAFSKYGEVVHHIMTAPFELNIEDIKIHLSDCDGVVICNPNNPTGHLVKRDDLIELLETGKMIVVDEAFIDFTDNEEENTLVSFIETYDNLIITKSMTKFFAMPGLRLGYMMTSNQGVLSDIKSQRMPWSINGLAALVGESVVKDINYINQTKVFIKEERLFLSQELKRLGIHVFLSQGNYLFIECSQSIDEKLKKYGIMVRNCNNYEGLKKGYYRVAVKDRKRNEILIKALKEILWK